MRVNIVQWKENCVQHILCIKFGNVRKLRVNGVYLKVNTVQSNGNIALRKERSDCVHVRVETLSVGNTADKHGVITDREENIKVGMARRLRSMKEDEFELGYVFERMVKGMRNEMNTVLWKMERSRDMSPEALKNMIRNGLESMVGAVEKVMNGVSDGMAKERKEREWDDMQKEERARKMEEDGQGAGRKRRKRERE